MTDNDFFWKGRRARVACLHFFLFTLCHQAQKCVQLSVAFEIKRTTKRLLLRSSFSPFDQQASVGCGASCVYYCNVLPLRPNANPFSSLAPKRRLSYDRVCLSAAIFLAAVINDIAKLCKTRLCGTGNLAGLPVCVWRAKFEAVVRGHHSSSQKRSETNKNRLG